MANARTNDADRDGDYVELNGMGRLQDALRTRIGNAGPGACGPQCWDYCGLLYRGRSGAIGALYIDAQHSGRTLDFGWSDAACAFRLWGDQRALHRGEALAWRLSDRAGGRAGSSGCIWNRAIDQQINQISELLRMYY